jgi:hypothetical protein
MNFFFHLASKDDRIFDTKGHEFSDLAAAHRHAMLLIHKMVSLDDMDWRGWSINVTDESNRSVLSVMFPRILRLALIAAAVSVFFAGWATAKLTVDALCTVTRCQPLESRATSSPVSVSDWEQIAAGQQPSAATLAVFEQRTAGQPDVITEFSTRMEICVCGRTRDDNGTNLTEARPA